MSRGAISNDQWELAALRLRLVRWRSWPVWKQQVGELNSYDSTLKGMIRNWKLEITNIERPSWNLLIEGPYTRETISAINQKFVAQEASCRSTNGLIKCEIQSHWRVINWFDETRKRLNSNHWSFAVILNDHLWLTNCEWTASKYTKSSHQVDNKKQTQGSKQAKWNSIYHRGCKRLAPKV